MPKKYMSTTHWPRPLVKRNYFAFFFSQIIDVYTGKKTKMAQETLTSPKPQSSPPWPGQFQTFPISECEECVYLKAFLFWWMSFMERKRPFFGSSRHADEKVRGTQFYFKGISDGVAEPGIRWWRINRFTSGKSTKFCFQKKRIPWKPVGLDEKGASLIFRLEMHGNDVVWWLKSDD